MELRRILKDSDPANAAEPVLLIIADISGYTRYMTANAKTLAHSQTIITELFKTILHQVELPLEVAELEGDAVFIVCRKLNHSPWSDRKRLIGDKMLTILQLFRRKIVELSRSTTCNCSACAHIEKLRLKIVIHSGEAIFYQILNFVKPAGVDVIIVHRLLKNSVNADQYLLLTEAARHDVEFPAHIHLRNGTETYDAIGQIKTLLYLPDTPPAAAPTSTETSFTRRFGKSWKLFCKLWFAPFAPRPRLANVDSEVGGMRRIGLALWTLLLTPIALPVGTIFVAFHALRKPAKLSRTASGQKHKPDDSTHVAGYR